MPLGDLNICETEVTDLSPLAGMKLTSLDISESRVADLTPLRGMPLERLDFGQSLVRDVSVLKGMRLKYLSFSPGSITNGLDSIRAMTSLQDIGTAEGEHLTPREFWQRYDAGEFDTQKSKDKK
jgi:Leucine-rich repeat (LRR) protein